MPAAKQRPSKPNMGKRTISCVSCDNKGATFKRRNAFTALRALGTCWSHAGQMLVEHDNSQEQQLEKFIENGAEDLRNSSY